MNKSQKQKEVNPKEKEVVKKTSMSLKPAWFRLLKG
jgi:hypothetical protein